MLTITDPEWKTYKNAYRMPYDVSILLRQLATSGESEMLWTELWNELHHQGDVDTASYATVPYLIDWARQNDSLNWNIFGLVATIELARPHNPEIPAELTNSYFQSIQDIPSIIATHQAKDWSPRLTQCIVSCIALARGQRELAKIYLEMDLDSGLVWLKEQIGE